MPSLPRYWRNDSGKARQCRLGGGPTLCQPEQKQRDGGGSSLDVQNPATDGCRAVDAGDDDTQQKERLDLESKAGIALNQTPNQPGGEKAVIEPLIGRQDR